MAAYIARRILLMFPTLLGILFVSFIVVQFAPGGPVERVLAQLSGADTGAASRVSGAWNAAMAEPENAPTSASPATAWIRIGGASATDAVTAPASGPRIR